MEEKWLQAKTGILAEVIIFINVRCSMNYIN